MELTVVYDDTGTIFYAGTEIIKDPVGIPFMVVNLPEGKTLTGINTSVTPHQPIFEEIPPSEIDQLKQTIADLTEIVLSGGI